MLPYSYSTNSTKETVKLQESNHKIIIKQKARAISQYLCKKFPEVEWSGFAIYKVVSGNIKDNNLLMELVDILLMDIGDAVYTEFDTGEVLSNFLFDNDYIDEDYYISLVHSHNKMSTFFSGTDLSTLEKFAKEYTHFVSTITNNKEEIISAITCKLSKDIQSTITTSIPSFEDSKYDLGKETTSSKKEEYAYYYLQVEKEEITQEYNFTELDARILEVQEEARKRAEEAKKLFSNKSKGYSNKSYKGYELYDEMSEFYRNQDTNYTVGKKTPAVSISKMPSNMNEEELFLFRILSLNIGYTANTFFCPATYTRHFLPIWIKKNLDNNLQDYDIVLDKIIKIALLFVSNEYSTVNYAIEAIKQISNKYPEIEEICNIIKLRLEYVLNEDGLIGNELPWIDDYYDALIDEDFEIM